MKASFLFFFLFLSLQVFSQNITARYARDNTKAYLGIHNPIYYTVENYSCKTVSLFATRGTIIDTQPCYFSFKPAKIGWDTIIVYKKGSKKRIGQFIIEVRPVPDPVVYVGRYQGRHVIKGAFITQGGIGASASPNLGFELNYYVVSFMTIVIRNNQVIFSQANTGHGFNAETKTFFKSLEKNDRVVFSSIVVKMSPEEQRIARPLEFIIEE